MHWPKKQSTSWRSARKKEEDSSLRFFIFETLSQRFLQNIFKDFRFLEKTQNRSFCFAILIFLNVFKKTKIYENVSQKSLWKSFENEKSETAIFFIFPRWSSCYTPFFQSTHFLRRKLQNKIACFNYFSGYPPL